MSTLRVLEKTMTAYRIGDPDGAYPIWSGQGAKENPGRWHVVGSDVIYTCEHYSTAMLEKIVHYSGGLPQNQHYIEIKIPSGVSYEVVTSDRLPGWHEKNQKAARAYGMNWFRESRSALLFVPSVVARVETNIVINAAHTDFGRIETGLETPIWWDDRLFA